MSSYPFPKCYLGRMCDMYIAVDAWRHMPTNEMSTDRHMVRFPWWWCGVLSAMRAWSRGGTCFRSDHDIMDSDIRVWHRHSRRAMCLVMEGTEGNGSEGQKSGQGFIRVWVPQQLKLQNTRSKLSLQRTYSFQPSVIRCRFWVGF